MKRYQVSSLAILLSLLVTSNSLSFVSASRSSQSANKDLYSPEIVLVKPAKGGFTTNLNTIVPGAIVPGKRASWVLNDAVIYDTQSRPFMVPGNFYP